MLWQKRKTEWLSVYLLFALVVTWLAGTAVSQERNIPHISSPEKDPDSKSQVWAVYHFATNIKSKNHKSTVINQGPSELFVILTNQIAVTLWYSVHFYFENT